MKSDARLSCRRLPQFKCEVGAFTVIELLVLIAMVALLASLSFPALVRAKEKGRQTVCVNNLRQLGFAAQLYWDDHEGRAFPYRSYATNNGDLYWFGWLERGAEGQRAFDRTSGALYPYLGGKGIEICPSLDYRLAEFKSKATGAAYGYGYNLLLSRPLGQPAFQITQLHAPASTALLADAAQVNTFQAPASPDHPMLEEFYYVTTNEPTAHFRHGKRAEVLFCDTHVEGQGVAPDTLDPRLINQRVGILESRCFDLQ
jgi:prepilin-type processing-associated H-X9-DG protein